MSEKELDVLQEKEVDESALYVKAAPKKESKLADILLPVVAGIALALAVIVVFVKLVNKKTIQPEPEIVVTQAEDNLEVYKDVQIDTSRLESGLERYGLSEADLTDEEKDFLIEEDFYLEVGVPLEIVQSSEENLRNKLVGNTYKMGDYTLTFYDESLGVKIGAKTLTGSWSLGFTERSETQLYLKVECSEFQYEGFVDFVGTYITLKEKPSDEKLSDKCVCILENVER